MWENISKLQTENVVFKALKLICYLHDRAKKKLYVFRQQFTISEHSDSSHAADHSIYINMQICSTLFSHVIK